LVAVTAGCDIVSYGGAAVIGMLASVALLFGIEFIDRKLKIDDPVGAIGVHGLCGALGTFCVGIFATDGGLLYGGGVSLLMIQSLGVFAVATWTLSTTYVLFKAIDLTVGLRVSEEEETSGLDIEEHGIESYADFAPRILYIK
jgi:Amt family ammonium transporter